MGSKGREEREGLSRQVTVTMRMVINGHKCTVQNQKQKKREEKEEAAPVLAGLVLYLYRMNV